MSPFDKEGQYTVLDNQNMNVWIMAWRGTEVEGYSWGERPG